MTEKDMCVLSKQESARVRRCCGEHLVGAAGGGQGKRRAQQRAQQPQRDLHRRARGRARRLLGVAATPPTPPLSYAILDRGSVAPLPRPQRVPAAVLPARPRNHQLAHGEAAHLLEPRGVGGHAAQPLTAASSVPASTRGWSLAATPASAA